MNQYVPQNWPIQIKKADSIEKSDTKSFQEHSSMFQLGYQDASEFNWNSLPLDNAFQLIDIYKVRALEKGNEYFAGLAQGAQDLVMQRQVAA